MRHAMGSQCEGCDWGEEDALQTKRNEITQMISELYTTLRHLFKHHVIATTIGTTENVTFLQFSGVTWSNQ